MTLSEGNNEDHENEEEGDDLKVEDNIDYHAYQESKLGEKAKVVQESDPCDEHKC